MKQCISQILVTSYGRVLQKLETHPSNQAVVTATSVTTTDMYTGKGNHLLAEFVQHFRSWWIAKLTQIHLKDLDNPLNNPLPLFLPRYLATASSGALLFGLLAALETSYREDSKQETQK